MSLLCVLFEISEFRIQLITNNESNIYVGITIYISILSSSVHILTIVPSSRNKNTTFKKWNSRLQSHYFGGNVYTPTVSLFNAIQAFSRLEQFHTSVNNGDTVHQYTGKVHKNQLTEKQEISIYFKLTRSANWYFDRTIVICSSANFPYSSSMRHNYSVFWERGFNSFLNKLFLILVSPHFESDYPINHVISPTIYYVPV